MDRSRPHDAPGRLTRGAALAAATSAVLAALAGAQAPPPSSFALAVPRGMQTGVVRVEASVRDPRVAAVRFEVDDWAKTSGPPFSLEFDVGPLPRETAVTAVALDAARSVLFRQQAIVNPGGRGAVLEILSPLDGQSLQGKTPVVVHVAAPPGDAVSSVTLESGGIERPLPGGELRTGVVDLGGETEALVARMRTAAGRLLERTIVLNGRGFSATSDVHVVEQTVAVTKGRTALEGLQTSDFTVRDDRGPCEVREVRLVRDAPLAVGLSIDTSLSLLYTQALRTAAAETFLAKTLRKGDVGFVHRFGVVVSETVPWTTDLALLKKQVLELGEDEVPGTLLYSAVLRALYAFQGGQGARSLVLVTDGYAFEDDTNEEDAVSYARQSGVRIYALGVPSSEVTRTPIRTTNPDGTVAVTEKVKVRTVAPNVEVLRRLTDPTGGRTFVVRKEEDLARIFGEIERDLRTQYLVSYVSNAKRRGAFHPVEIRASKGRVQTAVGFFY